jgi:uncharacterized protein (DUF885 family)
MVLGLVSCGPSEEEQRAQKEAAKFEKILTNYMNRYFEEHPQRGTEAGIHDYDGAMPTYTRERIVGYTDQLKKATNELALLDTKRLSPDLRLDYQILDNKIRGEALDLSEVRRWMGDPTAYNDLIMSSVLSLLDFRFDAPDTRLKSVISTENVCRKCIKGLRRRYEVSPRHRSAPVAVIHSAQGSSSRRSFSKI